MTAYWMRISGWSSDVCPSDLLSNFATLTLGDSLLVTETAATIVVHTTKNGDGHITPWPPILFEALQVYLRIYREYLRRDGPDDGRLWLGRDGAPITPGGPIGRAHV